MPCVALCRRCRMPEALWLASCLGRLSRWSTLSAWGLAMVLGRISHSTLVGKSRPWMRNNPKHNTHKYILFSKGIYVRPVIIFLRSGSAAARGMTYALRTEASRGNTLKLQQRREAFSLWIAQSMAQVNPPPCRNITSVVLFDIYY